MPICPICEDSGVLDSESEQPRFCYCAAGRRERRLWEASHGSGQGSIPKPVGFIDVSELEQVNANVDAMRASLLGAQTPEAAAGRPSAVQLLYRVAKAGHEISMAEAAQLHDLAKALESFMGDMSSIGRRRG
ncbi:hypothetical protein [Dictyobacter aurantiacus]|uniref:Uncharacterized protein n=1 Tax=Dictyobacter aurantiacus TaxID=1936993 RepID=A0A401Z9V2_9CHLR|nr:hypothetical protein [Dictyobacter aurantiacus]GCE03588.1 hypothetical protein KDAU_09170 [Dictyobacter aurantiacus]